ncbi:hypothetical protein PUN28_011404 [Cardiocondyla obscurior]|uniref:Uncharacterized protein n=1 Tax=Cardiocondyla obscurior TaxID=286306 RepID=A0AAW2FGD0_9HYME
MLAALRCEKEGTAVAFAAYKVVAGAKKVLATHGEINSIFGGALDVSGAIVKVSKYTCNGVKKD